jgi:putative heme utilization carrier protein HutX
MRRFAPGSSFVEALTDVARWGDVTVILHTDDGVMEFTGPVPPGKVAQGYYNLSGRAGFHGHLRHERCESIAFVERPLFGRLSAAMLFLNRDGGVMFKIFVGRDDKRELLPDQLAAFRALAGRLCGTAA